MTSNALHLSCLIGATALATVVAAAPAGATYDNAHGVRHHMAHSRIHSHRYGHRYGPVGVVRSAGAVAGEAAGGVFDAGVTAWDALDCATFGYYCRR